MVWLWLVGEEELRDLGTLPIWETGRWRAVTFRLVMAKAKCEGKRSKTVFKVMRRLENAIWSCTA